MKAVAYSIKSCEKEPLVRANNKKHDITLISNRLTLDTVSYAKGKEAVLVFSSDDLSAPVLNRLKELGVKYIFTRSSGVDHIDLEEAKRLGIQVTNTSSYSPDSIEALQVIAAKTIDNLDKWCISSDKGSNFPESPGSSSVQGFSQGSTVKQ